MLYMGESTLELLFCLKFPHTHIYVYINPPMDDKKGIGGLKIVVKETFECFSENRQNEF